MCDLVRQAPTYSFPPQITYEDGDEETMTLPSVKRHLLISQEKNRKAVEPKKKKKKDFRLELAMVGGWVRTSF